MLDDWDVNLWQTPARWENDTSKDRNIANLGTSKDIPEVRSEYLVVLLNKVGAAKTQKRVLSFYKIGENVAIKNYFAQNTVLNCKLVLDVLSLTVQTILAK